MRAIGITTYAGVNRLFRKRSCCRCYRAAAWCTCLSHFPPQPPLNPTARVSNTYGPRSYNEAISILYRANTFSFKDSECLQYFPTLVPRQRFEAIQSLKLHFFLWAFPSEDPNVKEHYEEIWRLIASMPQLRELRVQLTMRARPVIEDWKASEATWLAPLKGFKGLEVFELDLPLAEASEISKDIDLGECRMHTLPEQEDG